VSLKEEYASKVSAYFEDTPYGKWIRDEGVPRFTDWAVPDVWELETKPWARLGGNACFITIYPQMEGQRGMYVVDIPPGGKLEPIRHLYEQMILILEGHGTTEVWQEGGKKHIFEWQKGGSVFSPPLNSWYRMYNLSDQPAKFVAYNRAPGVFNEYDNVDFVFNCPFSFRDRFSGEENYFAVAPRPEGLRGTERSEIWETNFVPDAFSTDLDSAEYKVSAGHITAFRMAKNSMTAHISQWPVGRYHKAHYHGAGALLMGLKSEGYVLLWSRHAGLRPYETGHSEEVVEVKWGPGTIYAPPADWFHQHFNTGAEPARQLAIRHGSRLAGPGFAQLDARFINKNWNPQHISVKEGGHLLEYEDEDPEIRRRFSDAIGRNGVAFDMPEEIYQPGAAVDWEDPRLKQLIAVAD